MRQSLICHPDTPASTVNSVEMDMSLRQAGGWSLTFYVTPAAALKLPVPTPSMRTDGLWRHTCFELFLRAERSGYLEFNFSPSTQWAAYRFDRYRAGMDKLDLVEPPVIETGRQGSSFVLEATVSLDGVVPRPLVASLTAVIEESDGTKSYWALRHPPGKPDFHHPDGFALQLP